MNRNLARAAAERGWSYEPEKPELIGRWSGPPFPRLVKHQRIFDVVGGTVDGRAFYCVSGAARGRPGRDTPELRRAHDRHVGIAVGDDEFDRRFRVRSEEPQARAALLDADGLPLAFDAEDVRSWKLVRLDPDKLDPLLHLASTAAATRSGHARGRIATR